MTLDHLTIDVMQPLVGTSFWAEFPNGAKVELRVTEVVKIMENQAVRLKRMPFSVHFLGPLTYMLRQGTYMMSHDAFSEPLPMFLVPTAQTADGYNYEAVFT